jgi:hypothetical protein
VERISEQNMATTSLTRSLRRLSAWLFGSLAAPIMAYLAAAKSPEPQSAPLAPRRNSVACAPADLTAIEVAWPEDLAADSCRLVIGSLEDARRQTTVTISARSGECPVTHRPAQALMSVPNPLARDDESIILAHATGSFSANSSHMVDRPSDPLLAPLRPAIEVRSEWKSASRVFFLQTAPQRHQPVMTRLVAESSQVRIWEEHVSDGSTHPAELAWLIEYCESEILPKLTELYGEIADIDGDGKLAICLTDRLAELPTNESPVEGLVQVSDFQTDLPRPHSNQADVLFLSRALQPGPQTLAVLAHEAAHLAVFSRRFEADPHGFRPEHDWLNEGLAHFAEVHCSGSWTNLEARIAAFRRRPESSPLVVIDAQREGLWRDPGSRGAAWSFLRWVADEHGSQRISELARHPDVGCAKIEAVLRQPFAEIFRRWSVSQAATDSQTSDRNDEKSITLCGMAYHGRRLYRPAESAAGWRIEVPAGRQVQVTLVDPTTQPPRMWIVR